MGLFPGGFSAVAERQCGVRPGTATAAGLRSMMGQGGPVGGRMEILGFGEMHPGKVVTGAPV